MRIRDVAREAGVSTATVSHVINNTRFVADATRERVLRAIKKCNYLPHTAVRATGSGSRMIGLLVSDISNPFFAELVKSIESAAFERGYDVILSNTNYDTVRTSNYVRRMIEREVAGVVLMTWEMDPSLRQELARDQVSAVFLDVGQASERMSNLVVDYALGLDEAIRHLIRLGHRDIAYIAGPANLTSAVKRLQAFRNSTALHLPEVPARGIYEGDFQLEGGRRAASEILLSNELPTAVVAANDMMAMGAMKEFRSAGLRIPSDISIVGFDDISFAELTNPSLTTVCVPRTQLGRRAVDAIASIEGNGEPGVEIHIPTYLVARGSTATARARQ